MPRIALVTNVLAHYRVPCFHRLADQMAGQITFFVLAEKMEHRHYVMAQGQNGLPVVVLPGWKRSRFPDDDLHLNDIRPIVCGNYDLLILGGWDEPTYLLLWAWGVVRRKGVMFWVESTGREGPRSGLKERCKRGLLSRASGCIVPGKRAFQYCQQLGMSADRIFVAPNATDRVFFRKEADRLLCRRDRMRRESELHGPVILFVGRLVERIKRLSILIKAVGQLERNGKKVSLLIAGDGPDRDSYQELARTVGVTDIRFLGTLDHETLCRYYAMADVFALSSQEVWGFVLNEGMEFGLPVVVSEEVGAGSDLVRPGENGFVVPGGDVSALQRALDILVSDEQLRRRMGQASRTLIESFSPDQWAEGVLRGIHEVAKI
jgi:glycosyltransferase involved in cell wall biosynthesis